MSPTDYFDLLSLTQIVRSRLEAVLEYYRELLAEDFDQVFVSETVDQEGQRLIENLWVITPSYISEAHNVLSEDNFDVGVRGLFTHWFVKKTDYEPGEPNSKSRLFVTYNVADNVKGELKASGPNCDELFKLVRTVLLPGTRPAG